MYYLPFYFDHICCFRKVCKVIDVITKSGSTSKSPTVNGDTEEAMEVDEEKKYDLFHIVTEILMNTAFQLSV